MKKNSDADSTSPGTGRLGDTPSASSEGSAQASPYKSAAAELEGLRKTFRSVCQDYSKRIEGEIVRLRDLIATVGEKRQTGESNAKSPGRVGKKDVGPGGDHLYDLRDITTLLRTLEVKPLVGRRKDLKKIESLVEELRMLVDRWG